MIFDIKLHETLVPITFFEISFYGTVETFAFFIWISLSIQVSCTHCNSPIRKFIRSAFILMSAVLFIKNQWCEKVSQESQLKIISQTKSECNAARIHEDVDYQLRLDR